jgi:hypothetical protein
LNEFRNRSGGIVVDMNLCVPGQVQVKHTSAEQLLEGTKKCVSSSPNLQQWNKYGGNVITQNLMMEDVQSDINTFLNRHSKL